MEAYCVKCNERQELLDVTPTTTKTGRPASVGICSICGTRVFRMGGLGQSSQNRDAAPKTTPGSMSLSDTGALDTRQTLPILGALFIIDVLIILNGLRKN